MNIASGHLFLPKNKYQESQLRFEKKIVMTDPVNKELLTGTHSVNKELLTGTFRSITSSNNKYWSNLFTVITSIILQHLRVSISIKSLVLLS